MYEINSAYIVLFMMLLPATWLEQVLKRQAEDTVKVAGLLNRANHLRMN
jgi:hypothetical protein